MSEDTLRQQQQTIAEDYARRVFSGDQHDASCLPACRASSTPPVLHCSPLCSTKDSLTLPLAAAVNYDSNSDTKDTPLSQDRNALDCLQETLSSSQQLETATTAESADYGSANSTADNILVWASSQKLANSRAKQALLQDGWSRKTWKGHKGEDIAFKPHEEEGVWKYTITQPSGKKKEACLTLDRETGFVWQRLREPGSYYFKPQESGDVVTWYRSNGTLSVISWQANTQVYPEICGSGYVVAHSPEHSQPMFAQQSAQGKRQPRHRRPRQSG